MEKITLSGREFRIGFDFSTLLAIEDEFPGKSFSEVINSNSRTQRDSLVFLYAAIKAFNDDVPRFEDFIHLLTPANIAEIQRILLSEQQHFFSVPAGLPTHDDADDEKKA